MAKLHLCVQCGIFITSGTPQPHPTEKYPNGEPRMVCEQCLVLDAARRSREQALAEQQRKQLAPPRRAPVVVVVNRGSGRGGKKPLRIGMTKLR